MRRRWRSPGAARRLLSRAARGAAGGTGARDRGAARSARRHAGDHRGRDRPRGDAAAVAQTVERFGRLDVLVANAGRRAARHASGGGLGRPGNGAAHQHRRRAAQHPRGSSGAAAAGGGQIVIVSSVAGGGARALYLGLRRDQSLCQQPRPLAALRAGSRTTSA